MTDRPTMEPTRLRLWTALRSAMGRPPAGVTGRDVVPRSDTATAAKPVIEGRAVLGAEGPAVEFDLIPKAAGAPPWLPVSFVLLVLAPAIASLLYLVLLAAPQFVSESRFVVRGSLEKLAIDSIGQAAALSALNNSQEAHVVAEYIRSAQIVTDLSHDFDLKSVFSGSAWDVVWRLRKDASPDEMVDYWRRMVTASVDSTTGIVTVRVHSFRPADALDLNKAILRLGERLVAEFTGQIRTERLQRAEAELDAARTELSALLTTLEISRRRNDTLDPLESAKALADLVATLRDERALLTASRAAAASRLQADAPTLELTDDRIRSLDAQIELLLRAATGTSADRNLLNSASVFDFLQTRRELATKRLSRAEDAVTKAKLTSAQQQVYIEVFMSPTLGEIAVHPRPVVMTFAVLVVCAAVWALGVLYLETIRERVW